MSPRDKVDCVISITSIVQKKCIVREDNAVFPFSVEYRQCLNCHSFPLGGGGGDVECRVGDV